MSDPALSVAEATAPWADAVLGWVDQIPETLADTVEAVDRVWLPADTPPWTDTGIELRGGQWFSLFATGRVFWSRDEDQWAGPRHHLWGRVGGEAVWNPTQDATTRQSSRAGRLELSLLHGFWQDTGGELATSTRAYTHLRGGIDVLVVRYRGDAGAGLRALAEFAGHGSRFEREAERFASPTPRPPGWHYLLETGTSDVYRAVDTAYGAGIAVDSHNDQGILRKAVELPLDAATRIRWRWRLDEFPSERAEDTVQTHDYLSLAVEFDNGRDLTWFWSRNLPVGTHFGCPVKSWNYREIHYCVRSGEAGQGVWQSEERAIAPDCAEALGEVPTGIVAVWLIVVSSFQHQRARGVFSEVVIDTPTGAHRIL